MKIIKLIIICTLINISFASAEKHNFNEWLQNFKTYSLKKGISEKTFDLVMKDVKFLPKVIEYDRFQPEFYEDTKTYISKRSNRKKVISGMKIYKNNQKLIDTVEASFGVEKELLLVMLFYLLVYQTYHQHEDIHLSLG